MQEPITDLKKFIEEKRAELVIEIGEEEVAREIEAGIKFKNHLKSNIDKYLSKIGVPKRFLNPKSNTDKFDFKKGYFFFGPVGTGKTDSAVSLLKNIILNTDPVNDYGHFRMPNDLALFVSVPTMLLNIRSAFKNETADESELIKKYTRPEILVLDDLGTEKITEWVTQTLYVIINARYEDEKQIIITSNYDISKIRGNLNDKIASRIATMTKIIPLSGSDRRSGMAVVR